MNGHLFFRGAASFLNIIIAYSQCDSQIEIIGFTHNV
jgi:hypothetical protein